MSEQEQQVEQVKTPELSTFHFNGVFSDVNMTHWLASLHTPGPGENCRVFIGSQGGDVDNGLTLKTVLESKPFNIALIAERTVASSCWYPFTSRKYLRLTYANVMWYQHAPSYSPDMNHQEFMATIPSMIEWGQLGHLAMSEGVGLTHKETDEIFDPRGVTLLGIDTIFLGKYGITDGVIFREINKTSWIVLTREGLKLALIKDNYDTLKAKELLTDEFLEPFGLKQYVPTPRPLPTLKTAIAGLSHLTKQAEQRK